MYSAKHNPYIFPQSMFSLSRTKLIIICLLPDEEHEQTLKSFGVCTGDLSEKMRNDLKQLADMKTTTGLYELDITYLTEWYANKLEEQFPKKLAVSSLSSDVGCIDDSLLKCEAKQKESQK